MSAGAIDDLARELAQRGSRSVDEIQPMLDNALDESQANDLLEGIRGGGGGYQPQSLREEFALRAGDSLVPDTTELGKESANQVSGTAKALGATTVGLGAVGGGTAAALSWTDAQKMASQAETKAEQAAAVQSITENPNLTAEQKENLLEDLQSSDFFSSPSTGGGSGPLANLFGGLDPVTGFFVILLLYFGGKTAIAAAESMGGDGGGGGSGGGS